MDDPNVPDPELEKSTPVTDTVGDGAEPSPDVVIEDVGDGEDDASTEPQGDPA